jgi:Mn2+/Fe2+ NRAMP family transporter
MLALLRFTSSRAVWGALANGKTLAAVASVVALLAHSLNAVLLVKAF